MAAVAPGERPTPSQNMWSVAVGATLIAAMCALVSVPFVAFAHASWALLIAIPLVAAMTLALLWRTDWGLCVAAFGIGPLGIVQQEVAGITFNLPEVLILALVLKEAARFLVHGEALRPAVSRKAFGLYLAASLLAVATGFLRGNGAVRVLQDFRQFTEFILLYLLVVQRVTDVRVVRRLLGAFVLGGTTLAVHGIVQRYVPVGVRLTQVLHDAVMFGATRSGSFYGATPLGGLMVLTMGAALSLVLAPGHRVIRFAAGACACLCVVAIVFTHTRASWLALALTLAFVFLSIRKTAPVFLVTSVAVVVFAATLGGAVVERLAELKVSRTERSVLDRVRHYTVAWHIFRERPVLGLGWGCDYDPHEVLANKRYVTPISGKYDPVKATVHSAYLQVLVKSGLLGLTGLLAVVLNWLHSMWHERRVRFLYPADHLLYVGVTAGVLGYLFHCSFENFFQWPVMAQSFWLLLALSTVLEARITDRDASPEPHTPASNLPQCLKPC